MVLNVKTEIDFIPCSLTTFAFRGEQFFHLFFPSWYVEISSHQPSYEFGDF